MLNPFSRMQLIGEREKEQLIIADIPLEKTFEIRKNRPWLDLLKQGFSL